MTDRGSGAAPAAERPRPRTPTTDTPATKAPSRRFQPRSAPAPLLFNEGYVLAAHDPWEAAWLPLAEGGQTSVCSTG